MLWMHPQLGCCAFLVCSVESSGNLLWLTNSSKTHLLKKHKLRRTKRAREEQRALLINESLARRFVCLILPASTFFFSFSSLCFKLPQMELNKSFVTPESFCWVTAPLFGRDVRGDEQDSSLSDLHDPINVQIAMKTNEKCLKNSHKFQLTACGYKVVRGFLKFQWATVSTAGDILAELPFTAHSKQSHGWRE